MADDQGPTDRTAREQQYWDGHYDHSVRGREQRFYFALQTCRSRYMEKVRAAAAGGRALDYCCGEGETAFAVADVAAEVVGLDISAVAVEKGRLRAEAEHLGNTSFAVGDAHNTGLASESFDLVASTGVIHHLDPPQAWREIARLLKPGGSAIFVEALGHNPAVACYRALTPHARSPDERPLFRRDFRTAEALFEVADYEFYGLTTIASAFVQDSRFGAPAFRLTSAVDRFLLSIPGLRWGAWVVLVHLVKGAAPGRASA